MLWIYMQWEPSILSSGGLRVKYHTISASDWIYNESNNIHRYASSVLLEIFIGQSIAFAEVTEKMIFS